MAGRPPKPDQVRLVAYMPKEIADEIRRVAAENNKSIGDMIIVFFGYPIVTRRNEEK